MTLVKFKNGSDEPSRSLFNFPFLGGELFPDFFGENLLNGMQKSIPTNILEDDVAYKVEMAMPGFKKEEVEVELDQHFLTVKAHKEIKQEQGEPRYTRCDFSFQKMEKSFNIPENVQVDKIQAELKDGILSLIFPKNKVEKNPVRRISLT